MTYLKAALLVLLTCLFGLTYGQSDTVKTYLSIEEGLKEPEKVKKLALIGVQDADSLLLLAEFPNLISLSIVDDNSRVAPAFVSTLTGLRELRFINDDFYTLPDSYSNLVNLERIEFIYDTHLNIQNAFSFASSLPALKELRIEGLPGPVISDQLVFPEALRVLSLRNNHLNTLPQGIANLSQLEVLDIGNNEFLELPAYIAEMPNLSTIYLDQQPFLRFDYLFQVLRQNPTLNEVHLEGNHLSRNAADTYKQDALFKVFLDEDQHMKSALYAPHINMNLPPMPQTTYTPQTASYKIPLKRN